MASNPVERLRSLKRDGQGPLVLNAKQAEALIALCEELADTVDDKPVVCALCFARPCEDDCTYAAFAATLEPEKE